MVYGGAWAIWTLDHRIKSPRKNT